MLKWNLVKAGVVTLIVRGKNKATKEQIPSHNKAYSTSPLYFTAIGHFHPRLYIVFSISKYWWLIVTVTEFPILTHKITLERCPPLLTVAVGQQ